MELLKVLALHGPNVWSPIPVLEVLARPGELAVLPPERTTALKDRLLAWLSLPLTRRDRSARLRAFAERQQAGTDWAELLGLLTLELQSLCGTDVAFTAVDCSTAAGARLAVEFAEEALGRACLAAASEVLLAAARGQEYPFAVQVQQLQDLAETACLGHSTGAIVRAAKARGIPFLRLNTRSLVQLGHGARQRRILTAETDRTAVIGEYISQDKELTKRLLRSAGVPVPEGRLVADSADAWAAACELGPPVVLKPLNGNHGRGVFTDLSTREQIEAVFAFSQEEGDGVLVERCARGAEHRLLVVGDRVVAAMRGDPAVVVGDGRRSIPELIEQFNRDPRRGDEDECPLGPVEFNRASRSLLRVQGYQPESVPPAGAEVVLQRNGNLAIDVTDQVHPEVARCAVTAARVVGLDIAGIDIVAEDIGRPLEAQRGVIIEVNASPGLHVHLRPSTGEPRAVGEAIVSYLFPEGQTGRIPLVGVLEGPAAAEVIGILESLLTAAFGKVGTVGAAGAFFDRRPIAAHGGSTAGKVRNLLMNPLLAAGVFEVVPADVLSEGLAFDRCQVAIIPSAGGGVRAGADAADMADQRERAAGVLIGAVDPSGAVICRADDAWAPRAAALGAAKVILVAQDSEHPALRGHCAQGGTAVYLRGREIIVAEGSRQRWILPAVGPGHGKLRGDSSLAARLLAAAAAWSLGISQAAGKGSVLRS